MKHFIHWNGSIVDPEEFRIDPDNRGLRYGDGLFETMKTNKGDIVLGHLHFERLFNSLRILDFSMPPGFSHSYLREQVRLLLQKNFHTDLARVRLMIFRGNGIVNDETESSANCLIQSWPLTEADNSSLRIDIFPDARKSCDIFSGIKSNNYLCYQMAARFAKKNALDDALVLNAYGRIAESSIANVFIVKDELIKTPPLTEGCVNGVYRRYLLESLVRDGISCEQDCLTVDSILQADEVFLTNAIRGIMSVQQCGTSVYSSDTANDLRRRYHDTNSLDIS